MITLKQFAKYFEDGLNAALNDPEIQFVIWADAGKHQKPVRNGNKVYYMIPGNLVVSTAANDANNQITIGVNGLILNFAIPINRPRTNARQTVEDLQEIEDNDYPFVERIRAVVDNFFQQAVSTYMTDEKDVKYSVTYKAGRSATGTVEALPWISNAVQYSVYIEVTFAESGISSKSVTVMIDGNPVPYQSVRFGRSSVLERNVFSGENKSTSFASSTAFTIDMDFPATERGAPETALDFVSKGEPNVAHFVSVYTAYGDFSNLYFMTYSTVQAAAAGTNIMGVTAALSELSGNPALYTTPEKFGVFKFKYTDSVNPDGSPIILKFTFSYTPGYMFIAGIGAKQVALFPKQSIILNPSSFEWDEDEQAYFVTLVTSEKEIAPGKKVEIINSSADVIQVQ